MNSNLSRLPTTAHPFVYPLSFTADSTGFAKLWWRNALLTVVTLGLYFPWGRAAMLKYLAQHTWLDGQHLDFHGVPSRMLRPTLICGLFLGLYVLASYLSPTSGFIAALSFALLWPAIWLASIAFRMSQTSYGATDLRVRYTGTLVEAYEHVGAPLVLFTSRWLGWGLTAQCLTCTAPGPWCQPSLYAFGSHCFP